MFTGLLTLRKARADALCQHLSGAVMAERTTTSLRAQERERTPQDGRSARLWATAVMAKAPTVIMEYFILTIEYGIDVCGKGEVEDYWIESATVRCSVDDGETGSVGWCGKERLKYGWGKDGKALVQVLGGGRALGSQSDDGTTS